MSTSWIATYLRRGLTPFLDPVFYLALAPGLIGLALARPTLHLDWPTLLFKALAEELAFRMFLQESLDRVVAGRVVLGPLSLANLLASAAFALLHLVHHSPAAALPTFFPSLVFGYVWDRYRHPVPCTLVHFFYNLCLFNA
jgi:membrane protease YdiL (CAAX protease family)